MGICTYDVYEFILLWIVGLFKVGLVSCMCVM